MASLSNLCYIVLLISSVISAITYYGRKSDSSEALKHLADEGAPLRQATELELEAVFTAYNVRAQSSDVRLIRGAWKRHGMSSNGGNTKWHELIGEIEVKPFPNWDTLLIDDNVVEIVQGPGGVALPLSFNGVSLSDALAQKLETLKVEQAFQSGVPLANESSAVAAESDQGTPLDIYARRDETPAEASARARFAGDGVLWTTLCWSSMILLLAVIGVDADAPWLAIPVAFAGFCGLRTWTKLYRTPKGTPSQIRSLRGPLSFARAMRIGEQAVSAKVQGYLGNLTVEYPSHWLTAVVRSGATHADIDVDLKHNVVRHERLSLYDELQRFPVVRWGWHLAGVISAGAAVLIALMVAWPLRDSFNAAWTRVHGTHRALRADAPVSLLRDLPVTGDAVTLTGSAQCLQDDGKLSSDVQAFGGLSGSESATPSCLALGWNGAPVPLKAPELSADETALLDFDKTLSALPRSNRYDPTAAGSLWAQVLDQLSVGHIDDLNVLAQQLDHVCGTFASNTDCDALHHPITSLAELGDQSWDVVMQKARAGLLKKSVDLSIAEVDRLRGSLDSLGTEIERRAALKVARQASEAHRPVMIIDIADPGEAGLRMSDMASAELDLKKEASDVAAGPDNDSSASDDKTFNYASSVQTMLNNQFTLRGEVLSVSRDADGLTHLRVRTRAEPVSTVALVGPPVFLLFAVLLLAAHAIGLRRARTLRARRFEQVDADVEKRLF